jgi:hypothetical protein
MAEENKKIKTIDAYREVKTMLEQINMKIFIDKVYSPMPADVISLLHYAEEMYYESSPLFSINESEDSSEAIELGRPLARLVKLFKKYSSLLDVLNRNLACTIKANSMHVEIDEFKKYNNPAIYDIIGHLIDLINVMTNALVAFLIKLKETPSAVNCVPENDKDRSENYYNSLRAYIDDFISAVIGETSSTALLVIAALTIKEMNSPKSLKGDDKNERSSS